jgi:WXG100 family type VII secretion target
VSHISGSVEQLHELAQAFHREASEVEGLKHRLRVQIEGTHWQGPSAERFREVWTSEYEPVLQRLAEALIEAGVEARGRAERFRDAGA